MKKDGLFAAVLRGVVEEEKKKVAEKQPDIVFNQKKQLWYLMMNQIDGAPSDEEETEKPAADDHKQ